MTDSTPPIVTRFAPSPTGFLHAGVYRTGIFAYLYARKLGGKFVLRIEDTDKERSKKEYEENALECLSWLGLEYDRFVRQSENVSRHKEVLEKLIKEGHAYTSVETAKDGSGVMKEIIRFKNPNIDVTFLDEVKGSVTMNTTDLGDFVIAKNINEPLFHLAVVVDDFDEGVTLVIRGEDHVSNTPRQILIQRAIGAPTPIYAHLPLVLGTDKQKLSKRRGAFALSAYREQGYLPEAILNMVALVGWNPGTEQEIFSKSELISAFDLNRVQKSAAIFNPEKLEWINKEHIKQMTFDAQLAKISEFLPEAITSLPGYSDNILTRIAPIVLERITHFGMVNVMATEGDLTYYFTTPTYPVEKLYWKDECDNTKIANRLLRVHELLNTLPEAQFDSLGVKNTIWAYAEEEGRGSVLWPLRYALSGKDRSPDPFQLADILGKNETLKRITDAVSLCHANSTS